MPTSSPFLTTTRKSFSSVYRSWKPPQTLHQKSLLAVAILPPCRHQSPIMILVQLESLRFKSSSLEENMSLLQQQRDEAIAHAATSTEKVHDQIEEFEVILRENEEGFARKIDEELKAKLELEKQLEISRGKIEELESKTKVRNEVFEKILDSIREANSKANEFKEARKKEKRELESSLVSLTEENRDINSLLRIALVEKEAVEKNLNKLKGNNEQKRVALLHIAERGLQRVGFGFMMGSNEQAIESSGASSTSTNGSKSDNSECEEEVVSLLNLKFIWVKILKDSVSCTLRTTRPITSDCRVLQRNKFKKLKKTLYIKELEDREMVLAQNVEKLLTEIKENEAGVARWREACELEVEAGKKEAVILKQELDKTKAALEISNGKLKLKEELAAAAIAAQAASERSLKLVDSRAAGLVNGSRS
ncbi:U-box domain-containing protein kinase family protein, putative isoform 1 [Hibiscus syriacus]|uniref:U-box domain-containing protein kinase family protein, putative isoform 1 n=1 Tax=Hibiscus syriacus TaxID=106335 RepID=A0A6A3DAY5_HIBSY|nr:U-box domain-containing protein kinase family protein, putative isoform 1 [Hibiscus syriacus]